MDYKCAPPHLASEIVLENAVRNKGWWSGSTGRALEAKFKPQYHPKGGWGLEVWFKR
jgi:hypothetical protein